MVYLSCRHAAEYLSVSMAMMRIIARTGRAKIMRKKNRLFFEKDSLDTYRKNCHSRAMHFQPGEGGIKDIALYVGCSAQRIYYVLRKYSLPHRKHGCLTILKYADIDAIMAKCPQLFREDVGYLKKDLKL